MRTAVRVAAPTARAHARSSLFGPGSQGPRMVGTMIERGVCRAVGAVCVVGVEVGVVIVCGCSPDADALLMTSIGTRRYGPMSDDYQKSVQVGRERVLCPKKYADRLCPAAVPHRPAAVLHSTAPPGVSAVVSVVVDRAAHQIAAELDHLLRVVLGPVRALGDRGGGQPIEAARVGELGGGTGGPRCGADIDFSPGRSGC